MRFIKRKNLLEDEELLYIPHLHWFYLIKPAVKAIPFFLALLLLWRIPTSFAMFLDFRSLVIETGFMLIFFFVALIFLLYCLWHIFMYLSVEYGITNKRLIMKKGIIKLETLEISSDRIESIYCNQGLFGRIFRYGTIEISGVGGKTPVFFMVQKPFSVRRKIVEIIEKNKTITVVHGELPKAKPFIKPPEPPKEDPIHLFGTFVRVLPK